jgi:hypothetical protein
MSEGTLYVTSDQKENLSAIPGYSEKDLCTKVARAAVADAVSRGHKAWFLDPNKTWLLASGMIHNPAQVVFIHMNAPRTTPGPVFGVDCSHAPNKAWSDGLCAAVAKAAPIFPKGSVTTDTYIRGFCFWFYKRLRGIPPGMTHQVYPAYKGLRAVLEVGNMKCPSQAAFMRDHPDIVGRAIAGYCQPGSALVAWAQIKLSEHYDGMHGHALLPALTVDGVNEGRTTLRIRLFQSQHWFAGAPLEMTGQLDARTVAKLKTV